MIVHLEKQRYSRMRRRLWEFVLRHCRSCDFIPGACPDDCWINNRYKFNERYGFQNSI